MEQCRCSTIPDNIVLYQKALRAGGEGSQTPHHIQSMQICIDNSPAS